jgi:hypothetical protein
MVATDRDVVFVQCVEVRLQLLRIPVITGPVERLVLNGLPIFVYELSVLRDQLVVIRFDFVELVAEVLVHQPAL